MLKQLKVMAFKDLFKSKEVADLKDQVNVLQNVVKKQQEAYYHWPNFLSPIISQPFTGEKTPGEMGAAKDYTLWFQYLRVRSWQAYLESEIAQIIINKFAKWVIGQGLYVQPEPEKIVLKQEGISQIPDDFIRNVENRFNLWTSLRQSDVSEMFTYNSLSYEAFKNAKIGGDVLCINYPENGTVKVQVIDGSHVVSPSADSTLWKSAMDRGNRIEYGVEITPNNEHVAYYILGADGKYYRVERIGKRSGRLMAYLVYGSRYRLDNVRGLPQLSCVLETIKKLDRYKEATVGSAEERQKIALFIEHGANSTGESPYIEKMAQSKALGTQVAVETKSADEYEAAATKVATTTQKQAVNLPIGATMKMLESKNELYFKDFYVTNFQFVTASFGMPYEVALAMYNSNYSASRAAIKEWEYNLKFERNYFSEQFHQPFYNLWLEMSILTGKINAPGYIKGMNDKNIMLMEAYTAARFLGANVPHIDPLKEVMAERLKLADDTTPLTTHDQSTETLGTGDFNQIVEKTKIEQQTIEKNLTPKPVQPNQLMRNMIENLLIENNESIK